MTTVVLMLDFMRGQATLYTPKANPIIRIQLTKSCVRGGTWHPRRRRQDRAFISLTVIRHCAPPLLRRSTPVAASPK